MTGWNSLFSTPEEKCGFKKIFRAQSVGENVMFVCLVIIVMTFYYFFTHSRNQTQTMQVIMLNNQIS